MNVKFVTARGSNRLTSKSYYIGIPKHERTMSKKETYALCADRTGYKPTAVRAVFLALREYLRENAARGNITYVDGISSVRNYVRGAFEGLGGPWVKGKNYLMVESVEMDPFKTLLAGVVPQNDVGGAKPVINTVFDETTREYGEITGTDVFSIAGADLAPYSEKKDEYVCLTDGDGVEHKAEITYSDLQNVKAKFDVALPAGEYTLCVYTRSGMGDEFGVKKATRKVTVK